MKVPRDLRAAAKAARKQGWTIVVTGGGHLAWTNPQGHRVITSSSPHAFGRATANALADLRGAGLVLP